MEVRLSKRTDHCDVPCFGLTPLPSWRLPSSLVRPVGSLEAGMPAEDNDRTMMSFMTLWLTNDYSAGGLLADQAVLPLNIHHGSTSASMRRADAATKTQGDRHI